MKEGRPAVLSCVVADKRFLLSVRAITDSYFKLRREGMKTRTGSMNGDYNVLS